ncbi:hypothetical protein, partial [Bacteroides heparinolyticus]|uniref:hypothetical protein n=1 Tax=Prevotella heparinolytica TaxID=28113 RepID=UPI00359F56EC
MSGKQGAKNLFQLCSRAVRQRQETTRMQFGIPDSKVLSVFPDVPVDGRDRFLLAAGAGGLGQNSFERLL